jgi:hypothetical protein
VRSDLGKNRAITLSCGQGRAIRLSRGSYTKNLYVNARPKRSIALSCVLWRAITRFDLTVFVRRAGPIPPRTLNLLRKPLNYYANFDIGQLHKQFARFWRNRSRNVRRRGARCRTYRETTTVSQCNIHSFIHYLKGYSRGGQAAPRWAPNCRLGSYERNGRQWPCCWVLLMLFSGWDAGHWTALSTPQRIRCKRNELNARISS